jgi:exonuclease III
MSINIRGGHTKKCKYLLLVKQAMDEGISIIKCQETHSHDVHEIANYLAHLDNITVFESINTSNPNKGGVAIISLDKSLNLRLISKDSEPIIPGTVGNNWTDSMTQFERDSVELDSINGKWIVCKITWDKKEIHLANIYAPTINSKPGYVPNSDFLARNHFFRNLNGKWSQHTNLIVGGDFNNTPEILLDKKYIDPTKKSKRSWILKSISI